MYPLGKDTSQLVKTPLLVASRQNAKDQLQTLYLSIVMPIHYQSIFWKQPKETVLTAADNAYPTSHLGHDTYHTPHLGQDDIMTHIPLLTWVMHCFLLADLIASNRFSFSPFIYKTARVISSHFQHLPHQVCIHSLQLSDHSQSPITCFNFLNIIFPLPSIPSFLHCASQESLPPISYHPTVLPPPPSLSPLRGWRAALGIPRPWHIKSLHG